MPAPSLYEQLQPDAYWTPPKEQGLGQEPAHGADARVAAVAEAVRARAQEDPFKIEGYTTEEGPVPLPKKDQALLVVFDVRQDPYSYVPDSEPQPATLEEIAAFDAAAMSLGNDLLGGLDEQGTYAWAPRAGSTPRRVGRQPALLVASNVGRLVGGKGLAFGRSRFERGASSIRRVAIGTTYQTYAAGFRTLARPLSARLFRLDPASRG